jgi:hypothetical protein
MSLGVLAPPVLAHNEQKLSQSITETINKRTTSYCFSLDSSPENLKFLIPLHVYDILSCGITSLEPLMLLAW